MAIKGSLKEASLPDVLQLLSLGRKSGCLSITDRSSLGYIFFEHGRISYATVVNRRDRLGDILSKSGRITKQQLEEAIDLQAHDRDKKLTPIMGSPPDLFKPPEGCGYFARCPHSMAICQNRLPPASTVADSHESRCWLHHPEAPEVAELYQGGARTGSEES